MEWVWNEYVISLKCMESIWNGGGMDGLCGTVHMEWWWNGWSIWNSPCGMVVEWMVHMEQSMWNGGGMDGSYGTVHMEWWWSPCGMSIMHSMESITHFMDSII